MRRHHDRCGIKMLARHAAAAAWLGAVIAGAAWVVVAGCSVERDYRTLSFFFDGVPDPNAKPGVPGSGGVVVDIHQSPTYTAHKPWEEQKCNECHTARFQLGNKDSGVCLKCHAERTTEHERMHGPVAAGACLWCHTPHESAYAALFKGEARQVCTQCHESRLLSVQRVPEHADAARSCLECHFGHGGTEAYFLRQGRASSGPPASPEVPGNK